MQIKVNGKYKMMKREKVRRGTDVPRRINFKIYFL